MLHSIPNPYSPSARPKTPMFNLSYKQTIPEESHQNIPSIAITPTEMNDVDLIHASDEQAMGSPSKLGIHFADSVNESNSYNQTENLLRRPPTPPRKSSRKLKKKKQPQSPLRHTALINSLVENSDEELYRLIGGTKPLIPYAPQLHDLLWQVQQIESSIPIESHRFRHQLGLFESQLITEIEEVRMKNYQKEVKSLMELIEEYRAKPKDEEDVTTRRLETIDEEDETNVEGKNHQDILMQPTTVTKESEDTFASDASSMELTNYSNNTYSSSSRLQEIPWAKEIPKELLGNNAEEDKEILDKIAIYRTTAWTTDENDTWPLLNRKSNSVSETSKPKSPYLPPDQFVNYQSGYDAYTLTENKRDYLF